MLSMFLMGPLEEIRKLIEKEPNVYILLDASPVSAMISGYPEAVKRVLRQYNFLSFPMSNSLSIHTPLVEHFYQPIYDATIKCNIKPKSDLDFEIYSAALKKKVDATAESLAEFTASILTKHCDFYGLLEMLYDKGSRVFVDMGTGGNCLNWSKATFADRDALCFSIYPPVIDTWGSQFRVFAKLLSNHVHIDMDVFLNSFTYPFV